MSILEVRREVIELAHRQIDAYTAGKILPTGELLCYLSGAGVTDPIGLHRSAALQSRMPKKLKAKLGPDFQALQGRYKMSSGHWTKVTLYTTDNAWTIWRYHDRFNDNELAADLIDALGETSLSAHIANAFGHRVDNERMAEWIEIRFSTKRDYRELSSAAEAYYLNDRGFVPPFTYSNVANGINRGLFGKDAKTIRNEQNLSKNDLIRDHFGTEAVRRIDNVQKLAARRVISAGLKPTDAIKESIDLYGYEIISYLE